MKKIGLIVALVAVLCSPLSLFAKTDVSFSFLFDVAGMLARPHCPPPRVYERHIYVEPVYPIPYYERTTIIYPHYPIHREIIVRPHYYHPMLP